MPERSAGADRRVRFPSEPVQLAVALVAGALLAVGLLRDATAAELWRVAVLPPTLILVVHGLVGLANLGRAEWRRERPTARAYLAVVLRFLVAYVLVVAAVG